MLTGIAAVINLDIMLANTTTISNQAPNITQKVLTQKCLIYFCKNKKE